MTTIKRGDFVQHATYNQSEGVKIHGEPERVEYVIGERIHTDRGVVYTAGCCVRCDRVKLQARDLRAGDVFDNGTKKAVAVRKRGRRVWVEYRYAVADDAGRRSWYRQIITTSYGIQKHLEVIGRA
jgi:hypothetical protein